MSCELTLETCFSFAFLGLHWHKIGKNVAWVHVLHILHTNKALLERTELLNYLFVFFIIIMLGKKDALTLFSYFSSFLFFFVFVFFLL